MGFKDELNKGLKEIISTFKNQKIKTLNEIYNDLEEIKRNTSKGPNLRTKIEEIERINKDVRFMLDYYINLKKQIFILLSHIKEYKRVKKKEDSTQIEQIKFSLMDLLTQIHSKIKIETIIELRVAFDRYYWEAVYK